MLELDIVKHQRALVVAVVVIAPVRLHVDARIHPGSFVGHWMMYGTISSSARGRTEANDSKKGKDYVDKGESIVIHVVCVRGRWRRRP